MGRRGAAVAQGGSCAVAAAGPPSVAIEYAGRKPTLLLSGFRPASFPLVPRWQVPPACIVSICCRVSQRPRVQLCLLLLGRGRLAAPCCCRSSRQSGSSQAAAHQSRRGLFRCLSVVSSFPLVHYYKIASGPIVCRRSYHGAKLMLFCI